MTTADYALIISIVSVFIAIASFVWNVWSKFIFPKPKASASAGIFMMYTDAGSSNQHLAVTFTNHGPGELTLHLACIKYKPWPWSKALAAMLNPIHNFPYEPYESLGPFSGGLPKKLLVGEGHTIRFPYEANGFLALPFSHLGAVDTFGRDHWVPKKQIKAIRKQFKEDFPDAPARKWGEQPDQGELESNN
ncbi:hypothetical protein [Brevundimonas sp. TWP2-3-2]|uniref:hypothetical protein n=1 Tax=unclassified Brevundimonas TaxID=2622653 RepID=UPI003CE6C065